jgi:DNA-3-methyladenine glycosylase
MTRRRLERSFFGRPAPVVAEALVGKLLIAPGDGIVVRLVETEAYMADDPASHGYRRRTARNAPLYGPPGHAYVYLNYGIHWCLNISTGVDGVAEGCLLRAAEPVEGWDLLRRRRPGVRDRDLLRGPGRLGQAFALDGALSGADLCVEDSPLVVADDGARPPVDVGPRVGVSKAADLPWRYWTSGSPWVSAYKRSARAPAAPAAG